jgi:stress-induced-phosphoprotein 1
MSAASFKDAGNKHLQAKNYDEAIAAYTEAINLDPNDHVFFSNRSAAYLSKGEASNALSDAERCVKLNPTWPKGYSRKGAALHSLRKYDDAIAAYNEGLAIAPTDEGLKGGLQEVQKAKDAAASAPSGGGGNGGGLFGPQMLAKLAGHPKFGPKLGDPTFMMKLNMFQKNPQMMMQDPEMMEVLTAMLGGMGGEDEGNEPPPPTRPSATSSSSSQPSSSSSKPAPAPQAAPQEDPNMTDEQRASKRVRSESNTLKDEGNTFYKAKQFPEAVAKYDEAVAVDPTNIMVLNNKAAVYIESGDIDLALQTCQEVLDRAGSVKLPFEDRAKVYHRMASAHLKRNDIPAAITAYNKAQTENYDKAIERKIKTLELEQRKLATQQYINPELGAAAKERGNIAFREGNFPQAIQEYEEACKRDPKNAAYHNNLAAAYQKLGLFPDAKREVELSLELDKTYVKAWAKKGDIEFFMKEYHRSMDSYRAGLQIEPDNTLCKQGLQKVMQKVNEENNSGTMDSERQAHAMADPEIQNILRDPSIRQVLQDFQENPKFAQQAMANDADIRAKIEKLLAAGVLQAK